MITNIISWTAVTLVLTAAGAMLINRDWRIQLSSLALQYIATLWLTSLHLPFAMAATKLVTGWMIVAMLGMTQLSLIGNTEREYGTFSPRGNWYPIFLIGIVVLVTAGATPNLELAIPGLGYPVIAASMLLIGAGLLNLSLTSNILRVILGLLTMLAGFETLYAALESSILVAGLLAVTNLALGLVGCYLLMADHAAESTLPEDLS